MSKNRMIIKRFNIEVVIASIYLALTGIINVIALFWLFVMFVCDSYDGITTCIVVTYTACTAIYTTYIVKLIKSQVHSGNIIKCLQKKLIARYTLKIYLIIKGILVAAIALIIGENTLVFVIIPVVVYVVVSVISNYYIKLNIKHLVDLINEHKKLLEGEK